MGFSLRGILQNQAPSPISLSQTRHFCCAASTPGRAFALPDPGCRTIPTANSRLDGIIDSVVRDHVSNNDLVELVRSEGWEQARKEEAKEQLNVAPVSEPHLLGPGFEPPSEQNDRLVKGREEITREIVADASKLILEFGMQLLDIRITRINYVESVQQKVSRPDDFRPQAHCRPVPVGGRGRAGRDSGPDGAGIGQLTSEAYKKIAGNSRAS